MQDRVAFERERRGGQVHACSPGRWSRFHRARILEFFVSAVSSHTRARATMPRRLEDSTPNAHARRRPARLRAAYPSSNSPRPISDAPDIDAPVRSAPSMLSESSSGTDGRESACPLDRASTAHVFRPRHIRALAGAAPSPRRPESNRPSATSSVEGANALRHKYIRPPHSAYIGPPRCREVAAPPSIMPRVGRQLGARTSG